MNTDPDEERGGCPCLSVLIRVHLWLVLFSVPLCLCGSSSRPHHAGVRGMGLRVTLVQGGGSGFDQAPAVQAILRAAGVEVDWDEHLAGWASMVKGGAAVPDGLLRSIRANGRALKTRLLPPPAAAPEGPAGGP